MFLSEKLMYLQLNKTGCTYITNLFEESIPGESLTKHMRIPKAFEIKDRKVVGSIRNPWDWYVSLWGFGCDGGGGLYRRLTSRQMRGLGMFGQSNLNRLNYFHLLKFTMAQIKKPLREWQEVYSDSQSPELFRRWLHMILDSDSRYLIGNGYGFSSISSFAGLLTFFYLEKFVRSPEILFEGRICDMQALEKFDWQDCAVTEFIRLESLKDDFLRVMHDAGYDSCDFEELKGKNKNSSSRRKDITYYYDESTVQLVAKKEDFIIKKHGYSIPLLNH